MTANERLAQKAYELNIDFPKNLPALVSVRRVGNILWTSGSGCAEFRQGLIGSQLTFEDGYLACQHIATIQLGMIREYLGDLDKVDQILRVYGHVAVDDNFHDLDKVADGFTRCDGCRVRRSGQGAALDPGVAQPARGQHGCGAGSDPVGQGLGR